MPQQPLSPAGLGGFAVSGLRHPVDAFKLARMLSDGGRFPRLSAAGWAVVSTLNVAADALAEPLWARLGPRALWASLAAVVASLALPWVLPLLGWQSLLLTACSWYLGAIVGNVFWRWAMHRAGRKERLALMNLVGIDVDSINGRPLWYGLDLQPITVQEANDLLGQWMKRQVALTDLEGWSVSTIFTVLDQAITKPEYDGAPILWETAIFDSDGNIQDIGRYTSREEASRGHNRVVADLRNVFDQVKDVHAPDQRGSSDKG